MPSGVERPISRRLRTSAPSSTHTKPAAIHRYRLRASAVPVRGLAEGLIGRALLMAISRVADCVCSAFLSEYQTSAPYDMADTRMAVFIEPWPPNVVRAR